MDLRRLLAVPDQSALASAALLLLRLACGFAFTRYGSFKIANPFGWMGPDAFAPPPLQALAALAEYGGGFAWILGLFTPVASFAIACTMAVASWTHLAMRGDPFVNLTGGTGADKAVIFGCLALVLMCVGPGRYSLDRRLFGRR